MTELEIKSLIESLTKANENLNKALDTIKKGNESKTKFDDELRKLNKVLENRNESIDELTRKLNNTIKDLTINFSELDSALKNDISKLNETLKSANKGIKELVNTFNNVATKQDEIHEEDEEAFNKLNNKLDFIMSYINKTGDPTVLAELNKKEEIPATITEVVKKENGDEIAEACDNVETNPIEATPETLNEAQEESVKEENEPKETKPNKVLVSVTAYKKKSNGDPLVKLSKSKKFKYVYLNGVSEDHTSYEFRVSIDKNEKAIDVVKSILGNQINIKYDGDGIYSYTREEKKDGYISIPIMATK